ncbi:gas vesicle protein [Streptomyces daliensis]|uniref:Gas vesicle protein n=1 Tax=Streptomyces daliensis TaxID=299421 RepID=A0A8T4IHF0_9ACTN|nr:gas vesicle protein [Streptomyces daliensis]
MLDRLLAGGAVIAGDLTLRIADVDLVRIDLRALISSVNERVPSPFTDVKPLDDPRAAQDPPRERPLDHPYDPQDDDATEEPPS